MTGADRTRSADPGVPEALPRTLIRLRDYLGVDNIDRLWLFPPVRKGRREQGLIVVSLFQEGQERREVVTVAYTAEHTGKGVTVEPTFASVGEAPPDVFPPVMLGVVRRSGDESGEPREVVIEASPTTFEGLLGEFDDVFITAVDS
jgi:hypothetical protein